jgi:uncharacterized protein YeaO (DUF488 family)
MDVRTKRVHKPAASSDGYPILIDRLWPRGISREKARLDAWDRDLAPSTDLREWFAHDPSRFDEFRRRYVEELRAHRPGYEPYKDERGCLRVRNCPFHALAEQERDLVCGMNRRLIEGVVRGLGNETLEVVSDPVPGECCVRIEQPAR